MKKILLLLLAFSSVDLSAQITLRMNRLDSTKIGYCGTTPDLIKKKNSIGGLSSAQFVPQNQFPVDSIVRCGHFRLYYADRLNVVSGQRYGFYQPVLGPMRRNTFCAVLNYVQSVINIPANDTIDFIIDTSYSAVNPAPLNTGFLARATPLYNPTIVGVVPGVYPGFVHQHINQGTDPDPNNYDGYIHVNFNAITSPSFFQIFYWDDYLNTSAPCLWDLYSVLLHEVTHAMGWVSFIREDNTPNRNPMDIVPNNGFSLMDWRYFFYGNVTAPNTFNGNKLVIGTSASPFLNPAINFNTTPLRTNSIWLDSLGIPDNHPVYSGILDTNYVFIPGSVLSHLNYNWLSFHGMAQYSPGFQPRYVMAPSIFGEEIKRTWTYAEIRTLLQMGYTLLPAFAASTSLNGTDLNSVLLLNNTPAFRSNNSVPITLYNSNFLPETVTPDFNLINNNTLANPNIDSLIINISTLPNIADGNSDPISIMPNSLFAIRGVSMAGNNHNRLTILNPQNTLVSYKPSPGYIGLAQFAFYLWDGHEQGSLKIITVNVQPGSFVPPLGSELVVNSNYEDGIEVKQHILNMTKPYTAMHDGIEGEIYKGYHFAGGHPYSYLENGWNIGGGDLILNALHPCSAPVPAFRGVFGWGSCDFSPLNNFNHPLAGPNTLERYEQLAYGNYSFSTLMDSARRCRMYTFECDFSFPVNSGFTANQPFNFTVQFTTNPGNNPNNITVLQAIPFQTTVVNPNSVGQNNWQHFRDTVRYCSNTPARFFRIVPGTPGLYIDNISLKQVNPPALIANAGNNQSICPGQSANLSGSAINVLCSAIYTWNPGNLIGQNVTVTPSVTTTYTLTVNDGCRTATAMVTVTVNPTPVITFTPPNPSFCAGGSVSITASGANTYSWAPATGLSCTNCANPTASPTITTTYTVTGTSAAGCTGTATVIVTVLPRPTVTVSPNNPSVCSNDSVVLTASGANTYSWAPATGLSATTGSTVTASPTVTTTYTVTGTAANGCTGTTTFTVTVNPVPTVTVIPTSQTFCYGNSTTLTASGANTYSWAPAAGLNSTTGSQVTASPSVTTTYTVTGTNSSGCTGTAQTTITITGVCSGNTIIDDPNSNTFIINNFSPSAVLQDPVSMAIVDHIDIQAGSFIMSCPDVRVSGGRRITVRAGATLTIQRTWMHACGCMWDGIFVENGGTLIIGNNTVCIIEDAQNAVITQQVINSTAPAPIWQISSTIFNKNAIGCQFQSHPNSNALLSNYVRNCVFTCRVLPSTAVTLTNFNTIKTAIAGANSGYATTSTLDGLRSEIGIRSNENKINIGDPASAGYQNVFDYNDFGIFLSGSDAVIQNNRFTHIDGRQVGRSVFGICIYGTLQGYSVYPPLPDAIIGQYPAGNNPNAVNSFQDFFRAVEIHGFSKVRTINNTFNNTATLPQGPTTIGDHAQFYTDINELLVVTDNTISNCETGINYFRNTISPAALNTTYQIDRNTLDIAAPGFMRFGIMVSDIANNNITTNGGSISANFVSNCDNFCIKASNIQNLLNVFNNALMIKHQPAPNSQYDIWLEFCQNTHVVGNACLSTFSTTYNAANGGNWFLRGIYVDNSTSVELKCNGILRTGRCIEFNGNCFSPTAAGSFGVLSNTFYNSRTGLFLNSNAIIGNQGSAGNPIGNSWLGAPTAYDMGQTWDDVPIATNSAMNQLFCLLPSATQFPDPCCQQGAVPYATNNGLLQASGTPPSCPPPCFNCTTLVAPPLAAQLQAIVQNTSLITPFGQAAQWMRSNSAFRSLIANPFLMQQNTVLQNFFTGTQPAPMGRLAAVDTSISNRQFSNANIINNAVAASTTVEQNQKLFNSINLKLLMNPAYQFTMQDSIDLANIAIQCPLAGGNAVIQARNLMMWIADKMLAFGNNCSTTLREMENNDADVKANASKFKLFPNPNNGIMTLEYDLPENAGGEILIYDLTGQAIAKQALPANNKQAGIAIKDIAGGVYFYSVKVNGLAAYSGKVVIIK